MSGSIRPCLPGNGGTVSDLSFQNRGNQTTVSGRIEGTATRADGTTQLVDLVFTTLVGIGADSAREILTLDIGAINLDLLGRVVDIAPIPIDVTAVPGAGNLPCAVVGLRDGGAGGHLAKLLNDNLRPTWVDA